MYRNIPQVKAMLDSQAMAITGEVVPLIHINLIKFVCHNLHNKSISHSKNGCSDIPHIKPFCLQGSHYLAAEKILTLVSGNIIQTGKTPLL